MSEPFLIAAFLGTQALGDFVMQHLVSASVARAVPGSKMVSIYRDDRPYKALITLCNPYVTAPLKVPGDPNILIPLDWFDGRPRKPTSPFAEQWFEAGFHKPDLLLTPSMIEISQCVGPPPRFRFPDDTASILTEALARRGVDEDRWFACLHMRESGYQWRWEVDTQRTVDPRTYLPMILDIIKEQGGQVVRLGDPSMTPLPEIDGLIDLSRDGGSFPEQAFASARARYFIGTDTGPTQLAGAFKTPTATTNALGIGVWNPGDVVSLKRYAMPDGREFSSRELLEMGCLSAQRLIPPGTTFQDNSPDRLRAIARHMFDITKDCPGWRGEGTDAPYDPPGKVTLPLQGGNVVDLAAELTFWED